MDTLKEGLVSGWKEAQKQGEFLQISLLTEDFSSEFELAITTSSFKIAIFLIPAYKTANFIYPFFGETIHVLGFSNHLKKWFFNFWFFQKYWNQWFPSSELLLKLGLVVISKIKYPPNTKKNHVIFISSQI
jgi:hypothetical protein